MYFSPQLLEPWLSKQLVKRIEKAFFGVWRARLFRRQHALAVPASKILSKLEETASEIGDAHGLNWVFSYLSQETGFLPMQHRKRFYDSDWR